MELLVQHVGLKLNDEEDRLMYWVVRYLKEEMDMEKVVGLGLVVVEVVHSPSSAFLEIHEGLVLIVGGAGVGSGFAAGAGDAGGGK